jgi:hypothetical protein
MSHIELEDILEELLEKLYSLGGSKKNPKFPCKDKELYNYIDDHIDEWNIDIGNYYLDDIIDNLIALKNKREKLNNLPKDDDIVFKMDEEMEEQIQLESVIKEYDKIYKQACQIHFNNNENDTIKDNEYDIISSSPYSLDKGKSWTKILEKIDKLHEKQKLLNK